MKTECADRIRTLYKSNGNVITPDLVIADAKKSSSPLHEMFEWNLEAAALQTWRETARRLIRSIRIEVETTELRLPAKSIPPIEFVESPDKEDAKTQGYVRAAELVGDRELAVAAMLREIARVESSLNRAKEVAGVLGLADEVSVSLSGLLRLRKRVEEAA